MPIKQGTIREETAPMSAADTHGTDVAALAALLEGAQRVMAFTGAGMSTESGIDDFRSPGGVWSRMKPIQFSDFVADEKTRLEDWRRRFRFQAEFDAARPNAGHGAVAQLLNGSRGGGLVTQNIDGLHQRAGLADENIVEIHGNGTRASCLDCHAPMSLREASERIERTGAAPRCARCDGLVKANVISFGQAMPVEAVARAQAWARACDLCLVLGSSLVVQPAATIPVIAAQAGARLVIVNREPTPLDPVADLVVRLPIGEVLPAALDRLPDLGGADLP